jgi:YVTN family beta-propeller protein
LAIAVDSLKNRIYVVNGGDGTVSVIDGKNNTTIGKDITVGFTPSAIGIDSFTYTIYRSLA